jgi:hypothetical protein
LCITNGRTYISIKQAAEELGLSHGNIWSVLNGRRKNTKGYIFTYKKEIE